MSARSAGVLLFRRDSDGGIAVLLVRPGGPYWRGRDAGAWQIPKGLIEPGEAPAAAARREAEEELGVALAGTLRPLGTIRQAGGKVVEAFALEQDLDIARIRSNGFKLEWPPRSGRMQEFPEVEAARWLPLETASAMMLPSQRPLLEMLRAALAE